MIHVDRNPCNHPRTQLIYDLVALLALGDAVLRQLQRHHGDRDDLGGVGVTSEVMPISDICNAVRTETAMLYEVRVDLGTRHNIVFASRLGERVSRAEEIHHQGPAEMQGMQACRREPRGFNN
eukprot:scaffold118698_cov20-Tisochrysis_lutea.AAC.1